MGAKRKTARRLAKPARAVGEARLAYLVEPVQIGEIVTTLVKLSSKNQITLPVAGTRQLGIAAGEELELLCVGGVMYLEKHVTGKAQLDRIAGSMAHVPEWSTKEKIDAWVREGRDDDRDY